MINWPKELIDEGNKILESIDFNISSPSKDRVLNFFNMNPNDIKVVILGQDPYPTKGVANGRAFAVNEDIKEPQSLKNIFKEIEDVQGFVKTDKTLLHWEKQGVLLLNTSLSVEIGKPNSHKSLWKDFSNKLINWIDSNLNVTWILWGNEAMKFQKQLKNRCITDSHPSPLSVRHRKKNTFKEIDFIEW